MHAHKESNVPFRMRSERNPLSCRVFLVHSTPLAEVQLQTPARGALPVKYLSVVPGDEIVRNISIQGMQHAHRQLVNSFSFD